MPLLVLFYCDIFEAKDTSTVRRSVMLKSPCVRFMVTGEDFICSKWLMSGQEERARQLEVIF